MEKVSFLIIKVSVKIVVLHASNAKILHHLALNAKKVSIYLRENVFLNVHLFILLNKKLCNVWNVWGYVRNVIVI